MHYTYQAAQDKYDAKKTSRDNIYYKPDECEMDYDIGNKKERIIYDYYYDDSGAVQCCYRENLKRQIYDGSSNIDYDDYLDSLYYDD